MISAALSFLSFILGLFGVGKKDERDIERQAGERLGKAETENRNANAALDEVRAAVSARDAAADPGRLRDESDAGARKYQPGPD